MSGKIWLFYRKSEAVLPCRCGSYVAIRKTVQTDPIELVIADKPAGRKTETAKVSTDKVSERSDEKQPLIVENAILKERIALLNAEIEKLRAALTSLM